MTRNLEPGLGRGELVSGSESLQTQALDDDPGLLTPEAAALELEHDEAARLDASLAEVGPPRSLAQDAWRRFRRNKLALVGLVIVTFLILVALFGPLFVGSPYKLYTVTKEAPTNQHPFGTDSIGHDVLAQVVYGIRLSLFIGFVATAAETVLGILVGASAGWFGGAADSVLMRFVDILLGVPYLVLALALVTAIGRGVSAVVITLAVTAWLQTARTVRAGFLEKRDLEYVEAARAIGVPGRRIVFRHIMPNVFQPVVVLAAVGIGSAILAEAALSFLGVGVPPPTPSLGQMINQSQNYFTQAPHLLIFPGLAIIFTVLGFLLVGDGLRDALDVKDT
jgi:peptide/nickel transport system permease protein